MVNRNRDHQGFFLGQIVYAFLAQRSRCTNGLPKGTSVLGRIPHYQGITQPLSI